MNLINIIPDSPKPQPCDATTFFDILGRIDLTSLKNAIIGPERRGPKLKEPDAVIRLYLWYRCCLAVGTGGLPTVAGLRRELKDPESELANLCRFDGCKKPPDRTTISNLFRRIQEHPDLVRNVLLEINKLVAYTPPGKPSSSAKKAGKKPDQQNEPEPKNRNRENVDYRRHRGQEAVGDEEFNSIVDDEASAQNFMLSAIHGDRPHCHICPRKEAEGWSCTKDHDHGVVVEMPREPGQSRQWKCRCCESKLSVTAGTPLHGTNFSCRDILRTLRYMVHFRCGISAQDVAGFLNEDGRNASEGAVRYLMHRLRECMKEEQFERFKGETEIDEMLLRLNDGRRVSIISAYNRPTGRVRFKIIERKGKTKPKGNKREMLKFIRETTEPGSIILTDGDAATSNLAVIDRKHASVNHKRFQFLKYSDLGGALDKPIEVTVNRAEHIHGFMRRTLRIRNGIGRHHLERYLAEAMWRINHLHNKVESLAYDGEDRRNLSLMRDVLAGAAGRTITLKDLRGAPQKKRDKSSKRTMTAPVPSDERPEQKPLVPHTPIVPGAQQAENDKAEVKPSQSCPSPTPHPVPASHEKPLVPHTPIVPGAQQAENDKAEVKPSQSCPSPTPHPVPASHEKPERRFLPLPKHVFARRPKSDKVKPDQPCPSQTRRRVRPYHEKPKQQPLAPYEKDKAMGKPAPTGPLEEREQALMA